MRCILLSSFICLIIFCLCVGCTSNKDPYTPDYKNIKGYVIGKETCNADESQDYWLIDFTYLPNFPVVGDSVLFNGITYRNVLKTKGLDQRLKTIGLPVSIDYRVITTDKVVTNGCTVATPAVYPLKELTILDQGEIR